MKFVQCSCETDSDRLRRHQIDNANSPIVGVVRDDAVALKKRCEK